MRAVQIRAFGGPDVLIPTELPAPQPGAGQLIVATDVAGVLYLDTQLRSGWGRDYFALQLPTVLGVSAVGTVASIGSGVPSSWLGARVLTHTSGPGAYRGGGYADQVTGIAQLTHRVPNAVGAAEAIAAQDGVMAVSRLARAGLRVGDTALVTAASGSIGIWLVPLLHAAGVRVLAAARGDQKTRLAADRGADLVVDYGEENWTARLDHDIDAVFDGAGGALGSAAFDLLARGGRFLSYGSASGAFPDVQAAAARRDIEVIGIDAEFSADDMFTAQREALHLLATGQIEPVIGLSVPLDRAADAHRAIEQRTVLGRTVLTV